MLEKLPIIAGKAWGCRLYEVAGPAVALLLPPFVNLHQERPEGAQRDPASADEHDGELNGRDQPEPVIGGREIGQIANQYWNNFGPFINKEAVFSAGGSGPKLSR